MTNGVGLVRSRPGRPAFLLALLISLSARGLSDELEADAGPPDAGPPILLPCNQPKDDGCVQLATALVTPSGLARDPMRAATLFSRACEAGRGDACRGLGHLFESGTGTATSFSTAFRYYGKACDLGDSDGCVEAGSLLVEGVGVTQSNEKAAAMFQRGCDLGNGAACHRFAGLADMKLTTATTTTALYKKACEGGQQGACYNAELSLAAQTEACEKNADVLACWILGDLHLDGTGVKKAPTKAAQYYLTACDGGEGEACSSLAELYTTGTGVPKNRKQAAAFFRRACTQGDESACGRFAKAPRR